MVEVPGDSHTITCTRLTLRDGKRLFLRTKWFSTSFFVTALDFPRSWSHNVTKREIERRASMLGVSGEEFLMQSRLYLSEYGVSESEYSFEQMVQLPNGMRLSWTTTDMRFKEEPTMALFLLKDTNTMELVPEFLHALMDSTLMVQYEARRKINKYKNAHRLAIQFSTPEKARRRSLPQQASGREAMRGGLDGLVAKSEYPGSGPKYNPSYNARRVVSQQEAVPLYGHQTPFCFDRPHALGSYAGVSHGQVKSIPSGYCGISESKREQGQGRNEAVQVPMTDDHDFFLDRVGSSQLKIPVTVDVYDGMDIDPPSKHSQEFKARLYDHGLSSWAQPSKPSMVHDVAVHQTLRRSPTCDMSYELRKLGMETLDGSGWINPRKSNAGLESRSVFGIASQGQEGIITLSDSDEETFHNDDEISGGVMDGDDLLASERQWVTKDVGWQAEDIGWQSRSSKRKERDDAHDVRTDAHDVRTDARNRNGLDTQVRMSAATAARIKVESETHAGTFRYGRRAQWKPMSRTADNRSETLTSTFNHESRAQWNTWISEAKTEVLSWEARTQNRDSTTGGSCRIFDQPTENVVNTSSPSDFKDLHTPPSLKKLYRNLDVDFPQSDHLQSPAETPNLCIPPSEGNSVRERQEDVARNLAERPERSYTREIGKTKTWVASDNPEPEKAVAETREYILVENDGDSDSVEEHVYDEAGGYNDVDGVTTGIGESACNKLQNKQRVNSASIEKGAGGGTGRRGRPRGSKSQLHPKPLKPVSQARPIGRPKHSNSHGHPPAADYVVKKNLVDVDQDLQKAVPDSDYYCFDSDRGRDKIKPNEVWALYDDIDTMPRTLIRVKEVSVNGAFWVKATWLQPHNLKSERQKKTGSPISCGDFEEPKESTVIRALNCFSHKMEYAVKPYNVLQVYPRKGEVWALYHSDETGIVFSQSRLEKVRKGKGNDDDKYQFRLVVVLSNCGERQQFDISVLRKHTGYRTLWEPGYKKGSLSVAVLERFSHRVPAYKLTLKDYPELNHLDLWDIDAAAVPTCQSKVT